MAKLDNTWNNTEVEWNKNNLESSLEKISEIASDVHNTTDSIDKWIDFKEKFKAINENLSEKQRSAIWTEYLEYETMTISKITVIGFMLSAEEIKKEWPRNLALISIKELNKITKKYM